MWEKVPELRLGQLLVAAYQCNTNHGSGDIFYVTDEKLIEFVEALGESHAASNQAGI